MASHFIEPIESRRLLAAGTLDPSFGQSGIATLRASYHTGTVNQSATTLAMRVDSSGRVYVLSRVEQTLTLTRLTADGVADNRFAGTSGGRIVIDAPAQAIDETPNTYRLQVDASNRVYLLINNSLYRFTSSGRSDRTYGNRGRVKLDTDSIRFAAKDMTQFGPDGDMLVTGGADDRKSEIPGRSVGVFHIDADGKATYVLTAPQVFTGAASLFPGLYNPLIRQTADGKVVVAMEYRSYSQSGDSNTLKNRGIESFRLDGKLALDKTYGKNGRALLLFGSDNVGLVGIRANGGVVGADDRGSQGVVNIGITPQGQVDLTQTNFGSVLITAQFVRQPDGKEIVVDTGRKTTRRLNADNSIDSTFNAGRPLVGTEVVTVGTDGSVLLATSGKSEGDNVVDVRRVFGSEGPAARLVPSTLVAPGRQLPFRVVYRDDDGVNVGTITGQELRVISPDGTITRAVLTGVVERDGNVIADYFYHPTDNRITAADNGVYQVRLRGNSVFDTTNHAADVRTIGSLVVRI